MHEAGLVRSVAQRAAAIVEEADAPPRRIGIRVGALSGVDPESVLMHWTRLAAPSLMGAALDIEVEETASGANSMGVTLVYVDVGEGG